MRLIEINTTRAQLAEQLTTEGAPDGGVVLAPGFELALGEAVMMRVQPSELPVGVYLEGVVQWRRPLATRGQTAGIGVRLVTSSTPRWRFLRAWAAGEPVDDRRREWRHPARQPVILVTAPRGSTRIYPCSLAEVSREGALLAINHRLTLGEEGRCEWAVGARTFAVNIRVAWAAQGRAGVRLLWRGREDRGAWDELVDSVRSGLDALRLDPRPEAPPAAALHLRTTGARSITPPEAHETRAVPRADRGAVPERPIVELMPDPSRRRDPRRG